MLSQVVRPVLNAVLLSFAVVTAVGCEYAHSPPSAPAVDPAANLALLRAPSTDVLSVVSWGMAVVIGALVLAFVAKLLNGRPRQGPDPAKHKEP